ncbi:hypothetical protein B0H16DRAFT_1318094 [Mycena metata]|uniref:Uncharacterized protein n=1 Tax=Mycena metata TaxID=1033252 RepID=A0AAD7IVJ5_9AGAR|nr:hypothetical protein B0H16DRAFT_1318094 [Mycena metata]
MFFTGSKKQPDAPLVEKPWPGITHHDTPTVEKYLRRSGAKGGGSRSLFKMAMNKFSKPFRALGKTRRKEVEDTQFHELKWKNDHGNLRVFSANCEKIVQTRRPQPVPCPPCSTVLSSKAFKKTLNKPPKASKNAIYTNKRYQNRVIGEIYARTIGLQAIIEEPNAKNTPYVRYAQGALEGKYDNQVFNGLVEAMVTKIDREERGVGMQNFKYALAYDEFCNVLRISSPAAYRAFQEQLPGNFR